MARVTRVQLQEVDYRWDGQEIWVQAGRNTGWVLAGTQLEQIEILDDEGAVSGLFSIDFERQSWSCHGEPHAGDILLFDDNNNPVPLEITVSAEDILSESGHWFAQASLPPESVPDAVLTDPLNDLLDEDPPSLALLVDVADTAPLGDDILNDVISWLDFYSHYG